jgi:L-threonylcarbamoyladenylate synthase
LRRVLATWPGPVTWIVPARPFVPAWLTGGRGTLAVRVTAHPIASELAARAGGAIVSTSANRAGRSPLRSALAVRRAFHDDVDLVLVGPLGGADRPTEIRDAATGTTLRPG